MPVPKATGTQGNSRPAPASARIHSRSFAAKDGQAPKPDGAKPPACAAPRGGQVPANPCVRPGDLPGSAMSAPCTLTDDRYAISGCLGANSRNERRISVKDRITLTAGRSRKGDRAERSACRDGNQSRWSMLLEGL